MTNPADHPRVAELLNGAAMTSRERLQFVPARAVAEFLQQLSLDQLAAQEAQVFGCIASEIAVAERKAPGYLASRLIAQVDEHPLLLCGFPAVVVGGREFLAGKPADINWDAIRDEVAAKMRRYFAIVAADGHFPVKPHPRHDVRVLKLTQAIWFLFRLRDQAVRAVQNS